MLALLFITLCLLDFLFEVGHRILSPAQTPSEGSLFQPPAAPSPAAGRPYFGPAPLSLSGLLPPFAAH